MKLEWHDRYKFDETNVKNYVIDKGGNYMISVKLESGKYRPIYLGKAKYLEARLLRHLSDDEENECLKKHVNKYLLHFRYCYVNNEEDRMNIEHTLYEKYTPECNKVSPDGEKISITFPY